MKKIEFNTGWYFSSQDVGENRTLAHGRAVILPHTWNAEDGTNGGNDYHRGRCWYVKKFPRPALEDGDEVWLEFEGAAMTAVVFFNGTELARHEGGYSTFRVELTAYLEEENLLAVSVDNSVNDRVYPQKADFTFYGGLYRDVNLLIVPKVHFALDRMGGPALKITPVVSENLSSAAVTVEAWVSGPAEKVIFAMDGQEREAAVIDGKAQVLFELTQPHLWDGLNDPYLYTAQARIPGGDQAEVRFGCRRFQIDPEQGFLLNNRPYRLIGAARHQDRERLGNAISRVEHEEDVAILLEMGATSVRLAHYQHSQYFYDLCDKHGLIAWAEIPCITEHLSTARDNALSQMEELVTQCYNHPSIVCWGLSNEITVTGGVTAELTETHRQLNDLCHRLDATRPTVMAHAFMLNPDDPLVALPDVSSYNLYYGWYLGDLEQNDQFFDDFHQRHPDMPMGLSEYGADANPAYQSACPEKGDWTEGYQALYHEHMLKLWAERPYIWCMYCWNGFDFAADGRDEGGKPGQNQKGLVTFDRTTKKDAFYIYKAYLSKEPFVHLCGRRYKNRAEEQTEIKVYSNQPQVVLLVDGKEFAAQERDKIFKFTVPIQGEHTIEARAGECSDAMIIRKVDKPDPAYVKEGGDVVNWFDKPEELVREGYYSILDSMAELKKSPAAAAVLAKIMERASASYGDVAKNVQLPEAVQRQMDQMPLQKLLAQAGKAVGPEMVRQLNAALNQIPRVVSEEQR